MLLLHILDQSNSGIWTCLWKFQHLEHPLRNVTKTLLGDKLKNTAICHFWAIFYAKNHRVFVATTHHEVKFVKGRSGKQDFIAFVYVLTIGKWSRIHSQPKLNNIYSLKKLILAAGGAFLWPCLVDLTLVPPIIPPNIL
jgi:hypothetical protein